MFFERKMKYSARKFITFDLVVDEHFSEKIKRQITSAMRREYPNYKYLVTIDYDLENVD